MEQVEFTYRTERQEGTGDRSLARWGTVSGDRMVNVFNNYFVQRDFDTGPRASYTALDPPNANTFFLEATVEHEVSAVFLALKTAEVAMLMGCK